MPDLTAFVVEGDPVQFLSGAEYILDDAHHLKYFKSTRKYCERFRGRGWRRGLIENSAADAMPSQLTCHCQPDRTGANDKHVCGRFHFNLDAAGEPPRA